MGESRKKILKMLANGAITADEAEELLGALDERAAADDGVALKSTRGRKPTKLRVFVDANTSDLGGSNSKTENTRAKVNIAIPLGLVKTALPIAMSSIPKSAQEKMRDEGVDIAAIFKTVERAIEELDYDEDIVNIDAGGGTDTEAKVRVYFD